MSTWKLSIKPDAEEGYDPFDLCRKKSIIGVGWSYAFKGRNIRTKQESYQVLLEKEKRVPRQIKRLLDEVKAGDFVWLHQGGGYFLCRVKDDLTILGPQITEEFLSYDLGYARNADWVEVLGLLVPGRVQRSTIAQRTIQWMDVSNQQEEYFRQIHQQLSRDPDWLPNIDENEVEHFLSNATLDQLADILTPEDYEDLIAAFLQAKGWTLVKSTYFRTKPEFEFLVVKPGPAYGHVQVKSGGLQLRPSDYEKWVKNNEQVFLFCTHPEPYPGPPIAGVHPLDAREIISWVAANTWVLSLGLKLQIQTLLSARGTS
jgi:hypothetical protein